MPKALSLSKKETATHAIEILVRDPGSSIPLALVEAMKTLLTAMDYDDPALIKSHLNTAFEAIKDDVREDIRKRLGKPQAIRGLRQKILGILTGIPAESFDDFGKLLEARVNEDSKTLTDMRDGLLRLLKDHDYDVEGAAQIEQDIDELVELKKELVESWPWSDGMLPPVNRQMVAESRAAIALGKGESVKELIRRLGGESSKAG